MEEIWRISNIGCDDDILMNCIQKKFDILESELNGNKYEDPKNHDYDFCKDCNLEMLIDYQNASRLLRCNIQPEHSTYQPYTKEDNQLLYINTSSNHPPSIIKQFPTSISRRLSDNSSIEEIFNTAKTEYETALKNSGYSAPLSFTQRRPPKRQRKRNLIWSNPPYSKNVKTNIGKIFIKLINKHFPRSSDLHKIFNRNTLKLSYSCMENMAQIIRKHNKSVINPKRVPAPACNCRKKCDCPLSGNCLASSVIYKAIAQTPDNEEKVYLGLTEVTWKQRSYQHKHTFNNRKQEHSTSLSKFVWSTKDKNNNAPPKISWSILKHAPAYSNTTKRCMLCLQEKLAIITYPEQHKLLNKRSELISKCRHENKFLLRYYDSTFFP